jgi:hypothetical protein
MTDQAERTPTEDDSEPGDHRQHQHTDREESRVRDRSPQSDQRRFSDFAII